MKNISLLILILSFLSFNSDKKMAELKTDYKKLNSDLIGFYEYKTPEQSKNHYILIDTLNGKYNGLYFGTEDGQGHGIFFYKNELENLKIENENISFEIGNRKLFESTRFRILKQEKVEESNGFSNFKLNYRGKITDSGIELNCDSEFGYCWEKKLNFEKLKE